MHVPVHVHLHKAQVHVYDCEINVMYILIFVGTNLNFVFVLHGSQQTIYFNSFILCDKGCMGNFCKMENIKINTYSVTNAEVCKFTVAS